MKRLLFLPLGMLLLSSCEEKGPIIDFGPKAEETTFLAPVETQQQRTVLIEEFTGVTCPTCPPAHKVLKSISESNPRVAIVAIQPIGNAQTKPYNHGGIKTKNDNTSREGTDLANGIFGTISAIPVASFDRVPQNGVMLPLRTDWLTFMNARKDVPAKANIHVTSAYNAADSQAVIKVHIAYTSDVTGGQLLTVALVENGVVDAQELPVGDTARVAPNYVHEHVLRDILTSPTGTAIMDDKPTKVAGQVYERTFIYKLPPNVLDPANCHIVAFVSNNNGSDKEVVQATEVPLK